jgi:prepilin-type N-terminal cleavage/methylation domain-containing protein
MLKSMLTHLRETSMREFEGEEVAEAGFTLIELMVVLLIIAILLAIAIPTFLGVANSAGDRAAQSNLTNALTEAKALYQNAATYSPANVAMTTGTFSSSAPEFSWAQGTGTTGGCSASPTNCISEQVVDAGALTDGQGIILAAYSSKTQSCWYALDLESTPIALTSDTGVAFINGTTDVPTTTQTGGWTAGVFYAQKKSTTASPVTASNCNANWAASQTHFGWGLSYASPGAAQ